MSSFNLKLTALSGTAVLGALVVVFDYTLKFSGLKIPFPWLPFLKFDFTGIPIVLSLLLYGVKPGATTSIIALSAILLRSGDLLGASMKGLAEFATILGMTIGLQLHRNVRRPLSIGIGIAMRGLIMCMANIVVLPIAYSMPFEAAIAMIPLLTVFNCVQGAISILVGYFIYEAIKRRTTIPIQARMD
jgi:riboflavin transporter FmnP